MEFENQEQFNNRLQEVITVEVAENPKPFWIYLSFADEKEFRGGVIIEAHGVASAVYLATLLGINPHGEVQGVPIPDDQVPPTKYRNRVLTKDELNEFWEMAKLSELEAEDGRSGTN